MENLDFATKLIDWYRKNGRDLPWRNTKDPYKIWLSEVILQQTRVDQGLPYFNHFVLKFPNIYALARAEENEVLRSWQGLGYYTRARNLHKCAKTIVKKYGGTFPATREELQKLPGIGSYTSAAIASLAFGQKEAVVDGNVIRVISRIFGIEDDISLPKTIYSIRSMVDGLIPSKQPDHFNQAIMEFGAIQCVPKNPGCERCDFLGFCIAKKKKIQNQIPYKSKRTSKKTRYFYYFIISIENKYLLRKRIENDIWKGLYEFFLIASSENKRIDEMDLPQILSKQNKQWRIDNETKTYKHILTHQIIMCKFIMIKTTKDFEFEPMDWQDYKLYSKEEIRKLPKSILINRYLEDKLFD